jgi:excisionase family DNA binding protein
MGNILTIEQAAKMLQLNPQVVRQYLREGKLPGRKIGRHWRVDENELFGSTQDRVAPGSEIARRKWLALSQEERTRRVEAGSGMFAGGNRTLDDFLREKHAETDEEERRFLVRRWETLSVEEKRKIVDEVQGSLADMQFSSDDLIREKLEEAEREEEQLS